jgi:hypothetical protein
MKDFNFILKIGHRILKIQKYDFIQILYFLSEFELQNTEK